MIKSLKINTKAPLHNKALKSCSTSLPGGDLVDGLPPAASDREVVVNEHCSPLYQR